MPDAAVTGAEEELTDNRPARRSRDGVVAPVRSDRMVCASRYRRSGDYAAVGPTTRTSHGDTAVEANESFVVTLTAASGATTVDGSALGRITNDD